MTTTSRFPIGVRTVWPEQTDGDDYQYEHAIVVVPYADSIGIEQNGNTITIPLYALSHVLRAMRDAGREAEGK